MVEKRTVIRAMKARTYEPEGTRVMDEQDPIGHESTLGEVANRLNVHRVTLLRMEQRGEIPKARWRRAPTPKRVYNEIEIAEIKKIVDAKLAERDEGRNYVDAPSAS